MIIIRSSYKFYLVFSYIEVININPRYHRNRLKILPVRRTRHSIRHPCAFFIFTYHNNDKMIICICIKYLYLMDVVSLSSQEVALQQVKKIESIIPIIESSQLGEIRKTNTF